MNYKREDLQLSNGKAGIIYIQTNSQNSLTKANMRELGDILEEIQKDDTTKAVVITSENPKFFCNGLDAENLLNTPDEEFVEAVGEICILFGRMLRFDKPIITEVTGHAMGGGAVITVASDYKYMLESGCRIGFTEVLVGLPLPGMFVYRIQDVVHPNRIAEVCLESTTYKGKEAKEIGLIDEVGKTPQELRQLTLKKLDSLFRLPLSAIRYTKQNINRRALFEFELHLQNSQSWLEIPKIRKNLLESMKALIEKRRPKMDLS